MKPKNGAVSWFDILLGRGVFRRGGRKEVV